MSKWYIGSAFLIMSLSGCKGFCGDAATDAKNQDGLAEACDDGNDIIADGCDNDCTLSSGQDFVQTPGVASFGHTYEELSVLWLQWFVQQPRDANPAFDATGAFGSAFQPADVWFLAGSNEGPATRTITVPTGSLPEGRPLFFPILNSFFVTFPGIDPAFNLCEDNLTACSVATAAVDCAGIGAAVCAPSDANLQAARDAIAVDGTETLTVEIDGEVVVADGAKVVDSLLDFRTVSDIFSAEMPDFNIFDGADPVTENFCQNAACNAGGTSAGTYPDNVGDGYYILLAPLPAGEHTLKFVGTKGAFTTDVTYNLTIE